MRDWSHPTKYPLFFLNIYKHKSPILYWPCTTKYQAVPTYTDPVPPSTIQYRHILTQYYQVPTGITLWFIISSCTFEPTGSFFFLGLIWCVTHRILRLDFIKFSFYSILSLPTCQHPWALPSNWDENVYNFVLVQLWSLTVTIFPPFLWQPSEKLPKLTFRVQDVFSNRSLKIAVNSNKTHIYN